MALTEKFAAICLPRHFQWGKALSCLLFLYLTGNVFPAALAQDGEDLRYLTFEAVPIEILETEEKIDVRELASLPQAENPKTASAYMMEMVINTAFPVAGEFDVNIAEYEDRVKDLELSGGVYEQALSQELLSIGTLYQAQGEHENALEYMDKALHINRVNLGLFNLEQEAIIEKKIESHVALGDLLAADMQQEYLFFLKRKAFGSTSVDLLPALDSYAEWNIFAFDSRLSMDPTLTYAAESRVYTDNSVNNSIGTEDFRFVRLMNAQNIYRTIIEILLNNYGSSDPRLLDVERKLALTNYFYATNMNIQGNFNSNISGLSATSPQQNYYEMSRISSNSMGFRHGRDALERRLEYMLSMNDISPLEIARARIDLGDWLLMFKKRMTGLEIYEDAYSELKEAGAPQDDIDKLFSPLLPETIPSFIDYRYTRTAWNIPEDQALEYKGWIDVRVSLNRYGKPSKVEILNRSQETSDTIESRLYRQLKNTTTYRPRFRNGELLLEDQMEARYYFTY